jgi:hypothetical protein
MTTVYCLNKEAHGFFTCKSWKHGVIVSCRLACTQFAFDDVDSSLFSGFRGHSAKMSFTQGFCMLNFLFVGCPRN